MAIYDVNGNSLSSAYDVNGNSLSSAYDVDGNLIWSAQTEPTRLKVMTYNVQKWRGINSQEAMQTAIINTYQPDLIGMQELGTVTTLPTIGQNMLADYQYKILSNHVNKILTVSKNLPLTNIVIADYVNQEPQDQSQYNETRAYTKMDVQIDGKTISFINTHLCFITESVKWLQMKELFDIAQTCQYAIITGDFNSMEMSAEADDYINMYKQFVDAGYHLANNSPVSGFTNTFTSQSNATSLAELTTAPDTIIVTSNISIDNVVFDTTKFSYLNGSSIDHIAVVADLIIN